jgi:hypothetical protein
MITPDSYVIFKTIKSLHCKITYMDELRPGSMHVMHKKKQVHQHECTTVPFNLQEVGLQLWLMI